MMQNRKKIQHGQFCVHTLNEPDANFAVCTLSCLCYGESLNLDTDPPYLRAAQIEQTGGQTEAGTGAKRV